MNGYVDPAVISRQLGDAGYTSLSSSSGTYVTKQRVFHGENSARLLGAPQRGFKSTRESPGDKRSALVRFYGRAGAESTMLSNYRHVLNNCGYLINEQKDPDREGRVLLRVTKP